MKRAKMVLMDITVFGIAGASCALKARRGDVATIFTCDNGLCTAPVFVKTYTTDPAEMMDPITTTYVGTTDNAVACPHDPTDCGTVILYFNLY